LIEIHRKITRPQMLSLVVAHALAASPVNFTDIFAGTWDVTVSQLNATGLEESNATYSIVFQGTDEPGKLSGDLQGQDEDGAERVLDTVTIAPDDEPSSFSVSTSPAGTSDTIEKVTAFTLKSGLDGRLTAIGTAEELGNYSINILSPAAIELLVVNPDTKQLAVYRLLKKVPPAPRSMKMVLIQMAPMILMIVCQRFMTPAAPAHKPGEAKQKAD
jgi:hypothetical protein